MKNTIVLIYILLDSVVGFSQTNIYYPFPDSNAVWTISYYINNTMCTDDGYYQYALGGDTIIGGYIYKIFFGRVISCSACCGGIGSNGLDFIRQDTITKKVYWNYNGQDTLIYDFSLTVGDTLRSFLSCGMYSIVQSTDSILIGSQYRKRINLLHPNCSLVPAFMIEGVGSNFGLLQAFNSWAEAGSCLACFKLNNDTSSVLASSFCYQCSDIPANIIDQGKIINDLSIFPNPFSDFLTFNFSEVQNESTDVSIFNLLGERIYESIITAPYKLKTISLPHISSGIYFIKLNNTNDAAIVKRVIKCEL